MNPRYVRITPILTLVLLAAERPALAQGFDSGSDGSDGVLNVASGTFTLDLNTHADGVFRYSSITVASGATLNFIRNAVNTPATLLSQGDIVIAGTINLDGTVGTSNPPVGGRGGPGGFDGGTPGFGAAIVAGAGPGPGGGRGGSTPGRGAYGSTGGAINCGILPLDGPTYGSPLLVPTLGGSGGGGKPGTPGTGGSGGGGAILLASNTRIAITGSILARGGPPIGSGCPDTGAGSGGAVRLVAPVVQGNGTVNVTGGQGSGCCQGGHGRIRVDTIDRSSLLLTFTPLSAVSIGTFIKVFLEPHPRLEIVEAAGQVIDPATPAIIILPFASSPDQIVKVRATDFTAASMVPIRVMITPDSGDPTSFDADLIMGAGPTEIDVPVTLPINNTTRIFAWTR